MRRARSINRVGFWIGIQDRAGGRKAPRQLLVAGVVKRAWEWQGLVTEIFPSRPEIELPGDKEGQDHKTGTGKHHHLVQ